MAEQGKSDEDSSAEEEKEVPNLCFTAKEDEDLEVCDETFTFEELQDAFDEQYMELKMIYQKYNALR